MDLDPTSLVRVGGTAAGGYYELEPNILVAIPHEGYVQSAEGARASLAEMNRIAIERGRAVALMVLVDRVQSQDGESRKIWRQEMDPSLLCGVALVGGSMLGKAIASFFLGLSRPKVPTRVVGNAEEGLLWLRHQVEAHNG